MRGAATGRAEGSNRNVRCRQVSAAFGGAARCFSFHQRVLLDTPTVIGAFPEAVPGLAAPHQLPCVCIFGP